jgi:WD40 repeat protein
MWKLLSVLIIFSLFLLQCEKKKILEAYFPETSSAIHTDFTFDQESQDQIPEIFVQMGHVSGSFSYTNAVEFIGQGRYILSGNGDGTIKLWETQTGREVKTFHCEDDVTNIAVSADNQYLLSGDMSSMKNINLWDISSGEKLKFFNMSIDMSCNGYPVGFCNHDKNILYGGGEATIKLWDIESGEIIREFHSDLNSSIKPDVSSMVLTPDGKYVVAGYRYNGKTEIDSVMQDVTSGDLNTIKIWDINSGKEIAAFNKGNGWIEALGITPDGKYIISGDWQQDSVRVWEFKSGKQIAAYHTSGTSAIDISASGRYALLGGCMGFRLIELSTGKEIRIINTGIEGWVRAIKFSPDGKYALVGDDSSKPMLWDLVTGSLATAYGGYTNQLETVKISKNSNMMLAADDYNDAISIWDYRNGILLKTIARDSGSLMSSATISSDGKLMATGGWNGRTSSATIWNIASSKPVMRLELEEDNGSHTTFLHITDDNKYLIWAMQPHIVISDLQSGKEIKKIYDDSINPERIFVDPNGKYLFAPSYEGGTKLFSLPDGGFIRMLNKGKDISCIMGEDYLYEFKSVRDEYDQRGNFLSKYNLTTLNEKTIKIREIYFNFGIEYNPDFLFFCFNFAEDIAKYDINKDKIVATLTGHTKSIVNLDRTPDGKFICSGSLDGTVRFWNPGTGQEVAQFISFKDGEWIVITPEGYFNASANGAKYLNVRVGNQVYSIDNFHEKYYNPVYVASVLQGSTLESVPDIRQGIAPPPMVRIVSPQPDAEFNMEEITVTLFAKDLGGGIDEIRLYQNGKVVSEETRGMKVKAGQQALAHSVSSRDITKSYTLNLVEGINTFRAVGFSKDRTESNPAEIMVKLVGHGKDVSLHVLTIGLNEYQNPALNLNYARPDAQGIMEFFKQNGKGLFKNVSITELYNEQATKAGILSKLNQLVNTYPEDAVVIYLAGHGENIEEDWYFIPYELTYPEREEEVKSKALSSDELSTCIRDIKAQKILLLIDACKSGAALVAFRGFEDRKALSQLSRATGVHVVAASGKDQFASEVKELGHGVFTYTLLEGLKGRAAGNGETVTVRKLLGYLEEELPELTKKYRQEAQYPVVDSRGMDFPLVVNK